MRMTKVLLSVAVLAAACSRREMSLPTDPIAGAAKPRLQTEARAADHVQSATGHVDQAEIPFDVVVIDQYSFSAVRTPQGRINGQFEFRAKYQDLVVRAHGDVDCLTINGNHARIAGHVTQSTFEAGIPTGSELTWTVTDNGEPGDGRDTASEMLGFSRELFCAEPRGQYPEAPIRRGNIQVRP